MASHSGTVRPTLCPIPRIGQNVGLSDNPTCVWSEENGLGGGFPAVADRDDATPADFGIEAQTVAHLCWGAVPSFHVVLGIFAFATIRTWTVNLGGGMGGCGVCTNDRIG